MPALLRRLSVLALSFLLALGLATSTEGIGVRKGGSGAQSSITSTTYPRTFWVVGCIHLGGPFGGTSPKNWFQLSALIDSLNLARAAGRCDFLLVAGDWAEDGFQLYPERADTLMAIRGRARFPIWFGLGNHEAVASDTVAARSPYATAMSRFPQLYADGKEYWARDTDFFRVLFVQNNANYNVSDPSSDYRVNNPSGYAGPGGVPGYDYNGIQVPMSPQREFISDQIKALGYRQLVIVGHRSVYGSNANINSRMNFGSAARGLGYIRAVEQALPPGRRALNVAADQHLFMLTEALNDSHLCAHTESGLYHLQQISGGGLRQVDTTSVLPAPNRVYQSFLGLKVNDGTRLTARTSAQVMDTTTVGSDPDLSRPWLATEVQAWGDQWVVRTYRVWTGNSAGARGYNGAGNLTCIDERVLTMDNYRGSPNQLGVDTAPVVAVTAPNGGENWTGGTQRTITWTAIDDLGVSHVDIAYSTNAGASWTDLSTGELNDGSYLWSVPAFPTAQARIRVTAYDALLQSASDASDANFTIAVADLAAPAVTVLTPNGGGIFAMGSLMSITWTATDNIAVSSITLEYSSTGSAGTYSAIAAGEENDGLYVWTLPNITSTDFLVRVKAVDTSGNIGSDVGNAYFAVRDLTPPVVNLTAPNGGETWVGGNPHNITWAASDNIGVESVTIAYKANPDAALWTPIIIGAANSGTYAWTVPTIDAPWVKMRVRALDDAGNVGIDSSAAPFSIGSTDSTPPGPVTNLTPAAPGANSIGLVWVAPGDDSLDGTAASYDIRYSTSPITVNGRTDIVGNGTFVPANGVHMSGNYAQAVAFGSGFYSPAAAAALLMNQKHPMFHFVENGSGSITYDYMAALSAVCGATYQNTPTNGSFNISTIANPEGQVLGGLGFPTGPGGIVGGVAYRFFTGGEVYVNLTNTPQTIPVVPGQVAEAGVPLDPRSYWIEPFDQDRRGPGKYPQKGGLYWGNLTTTAIGNLADWDDIVLNDSNINGPRDAITSIPALPVDRINAIRKLNPTARIGFSFNGLNIFVGSNGAPSVYWPQQVRMYYKANVMGAWILENGIPKEVVAPWGRVRFVDFTHEAFRTWLAADIDSTIQAVGVDYLFIDELRSGISDLRNPNNTYPSNEVWTAAMNDLMDRVENGISAPVQLQNEPTPLVSGMSQSAMVVGLTPRTRYFFNLRTADEASNVSLASNTAHDTTLAITNLSGSPEFQAFTAYCAGNFSALGEPMVRTTFGVSLSFVNDGQWIHASRNSVCVAFESNLPCKTYVEYGPTDAYGSRTPVAERYFYHHVAYLKGLTPGATYHYRLVGVSEDGQQVGSSDQTITTGTFPGAILVSAPGTVCDVPNATYILTQDIVAPTRGISIKANGVTVDLNGFTITYDTSAPVGSGLQSDTSTSGVHFFLYNASDVTPIRVLNGTIIQGSNNGSGTNGVPFGPVAIYTGKAEVAGITAEWKGADVNGIHNMWGVTHAHHNVLSDGGTVTTNRSQGTIAIFTAGTGNTNSEGVHHNLIRRGRHQGIMTKSSENGTAGVYGNEIYMDVYATNGFGVGPVTNVYNNKIFGTGYHCVGVGFLEHSTMWVRNNFIFMQGEAPSLRDTEYGLDASIIGMRLTQYLGSNFLYNNYLYENNVIVMKGRGGTLSIRGIQLHSDPNVVNCLARNNYVKIEMQDEITRGACITTQGNCTDTLINANSLPIVYENNTLVSNDTFVRFGDQYASGGIHYIRNCSFTKFGNRAHFTPLRIGFGDCMTFGSRIIDPARGAGVNFHAPQVDGHGRRDYLVGHSLYIRALGTGGTPLGSRAVTVHDSSGLSYAGTTNSSGVARLELVEDYYSAPPFASTITRTTRTGHNLQTAGYQAFAVNAGLFAISDNAGTPVDVQFVP